MEIPALQLPPAVQQHLFASGAEAARELAVLVGGCLRQGVREREAASLIVSGGRTPAPFLEALSQQTLDWPRVVVSLADDRWVPPQHQDSNEYLLRRHLLRGRAAVARFVPLVNAQVTPQQHLPAAEARLDQLPRPYDAVVLGMGEDGHTASLFPGADGTAEALDTRRPQRLAAITPLTAPHPRISLTLRALLDSRGLTILIQGESKRAVIERAAACDPAQFAIAAILQQRKVPVHLYYSP